MSPHPNTAMTAKCEGVVCIAYRPLCRSFAFVITRLSTAVQVARIYARQGHPHPIAGRTNLATQYTVARQLLKTVSADKAKLCPPIVSFPYLMSVIWRGIQLRSGLLKETLCSVCCVLISSCDMYPRHSSHEEERGCVYMRWFFSPSVCLFFEVEKDSQK